MVALSLLSRLLLTISACIPSLCAQSLSIPLVRVARQLAPQQVNLISSNVSVFNSDGYAYLAQMDIGNQSFLVLLDTGSSDLWVVSSDCAETDCQTVPKYRNSPTLNLSSTPFDLQYLLGSVSGTVGTETVALGPFEISSQVFALANDTTGLGLAGTGNSGILGLSFPLEAAIPETAGTPILENLLSTFNDSDRYFAVKLGRDRNSSSFTLGKLDPTFANSTDELAWTAVYPAGVGLSASERDSDDYYDYWKIPLQALTINATSFALSDSRVHGAPSPIAVFDTGTTLILGPSQDVDRFWGSIGGTMKTDDGWKVRCDRGVVIGFVLGTGDSQKEYFVDPADLSWIEGGRDGDWCMGGIQANDAVSSGDWLLGDTFLRNVYIAHHAATTGSPPMIGLLGLTDPQASLASFRAARGDDPTTPVPVQSDATRSSHGLSGAAVCGISAGSGVVFGVLFMVALGLCIDRRPKKY